MDGLIVEQEGAVRILRLNRPEKRNALNHALSTGLLDALRNADADGRVRAVVLCGAGTSFCAGADLSEFSSLVTEGPEAVTGRAELTMHLQHVFFEISKPVVGAVHGHAMGGGAGLALACDLLVMAEGARIGYPELKHGIVAAVVMANLVRQLGRKPAFELVALAEPISSARALELGLVNRVVPEGELMPEALRLAQVLARHHPLAMAATKQLFHRVADLPLGQALQAGRDANVIMRSFKASASDSSN